MRMRVVRFESRNPVVVALVAALLVALLVALLTVGLAVAAGLAAVGGAALLARRAFGRRRPFLPPPDRGALEPLDPALEVMPPTPDDRRLGGGDDR
jgi:hypothetical protein